MQDGSGYVYISFIKPLPKTLQLYQKRTVFENIKMH